MQRPVPIELHRFLYGLDLPPRFRDWLYANLERLESSLGRADFLALIELDFADRHRVVDLVGRLKQRVLPLAARPEDDYVADYLVMADQLQAEGDPRGELITLQASLLESGQQVLSEAELVEKHEDALLGPLARYVYDGRLKLEWFMGFAVRAAIAETGSREAASIARTLLEHPSGRRLRALRVESRGNARRNLGFIPVIDVLGSMPTPLTTLILDTGDEVLAHGLGDVGQLLSRQASLRVVELNGAQAMLGALPPEVMSFTLRTPSLAAGSARALATSIAPRLERLELWLGYDTPVAELEPLLARERLPRLRHLSLPGAPGAIIDVLLASDLLPQLATLDLSRALINAERARSIVDGAPSFAHLEWFDLRWNDIGEMIVGALGRTIPRAQVLDQGRPFELRRTDLRGEPWW